MILLSDKDRIIGEKTAVALGLFDGVHKGHRLVIGQAVSRRPKLKAAVFSFKTDTVTSKRADGAPPEMLLSESDKLKAFERLGADYVYSPEFSQLKNMTPEEFIKNILIDRLSCSFAVCGEDFRFGAKAMGNADTLKEYGEKYGFEVCVIKQMKSDGAAISSTKIRSLIKSGDIAKANSLLSSRYGYTLPVEHGFQRGRTWGFPTINQTIPEGLVLPRFGVYCSKVLIDGIWHEAITNIGVKPTVEKNSPPLAETFIIDYDGDLYGRTLTTELYEFVRPERTFATFDELKAEIGRNIEQVKRYFSEQG